MKVAGNHTWGHLHPRKPNKLHHIRFGQIFRTEMLQDACFTVLSSKKYLNPFLNEGGGQQLKERNDTDSHRNGF